MADATQRKTVSMRFPEDQLARVEKWCKKTADKRSKFIIRCGWKQAKRILSGQLPLYEEPSKKSGKQVQTHTVIVSLPEAYRATIEEACQKMRHRLSLFLVWSTLAELATAQSKNPKG